MSSQQRVDGRPRGSHSLYLIYILLVVIFFCLLSLLLFLVGLLICRLGQDDAELQLYLDHYFHNWLSLLIVILTVVTLVLALILILFAIYLVKVHQNRSKRGELPLWTPALGQRNWNRSFREVTTSRTESRTRGNNEAEQHHYTHPKLQRKCLLESIDMEKTITFH